MTENISVDIRNTKAYFHYVGIKMHPAIKKLQFRLAFIGEGKMKFYSPVRTGTLRRSIHAYPTRSPFGIATNVNYARIANVRSSKPNFIEQTVNHLERIAVPEAQKIVNEVIQQRGY